MIWFVFQMIGRGFFGTDAHQRCAHLELPACGKPATQICISLQRKPPVNRQFS